MTQSVLIIGASSHIGQAIARQCASQGAVVSLISRQPASDPNAEFYYQDALQSADSSQHCIEQALAQQPDTIFICNGVLHDATAMPEKTIGQLDSAQLAQRLHSNVIIPAQYLRALLRYLTRTPQVKVLVLSAKVGSITDNRLGGWYSYRMSKAALNMLVKNLSLEVARLNPSACIVTLHPGTTDTPLSEPFQTNLPQGQLQTAAQTAQRLLQVRDVLTPGHSGTLLNWDASVLPF
ncbi:MAG: SDR family NAD(P)-dependent oxidoreductase [Pseudomonas sp.]|jgi:NAD(P)-dependent dehydrogenase (short-subunit alcohol dehydrogenase family)|nr:SDR family NAD(P)-dependent oxidoreductase [Pseudomonas sp.]MDD2223871.1 SDR family NAD(P)-dependent oxidoreductase [Pseudomonas sp.]MDY0414057.1 SDR family NAD(P)-dependent oxidoreductase [Pseudomonas sp.]NLO55268.1 SDR family NAD(P)-dependent oxidoreductase [Gammaproteobacteria bacterium]